MNRKKLNRLTKDGIKEILIVIKKLGLPLVIFGVFFIIYSWIGGRPAITFTQLIIVFLFLALLQVTFENIWIEKEVDELKKRLKQLEDQCNIKEDNLR